jgi:hypothetical protein
MIGKSHGLATRRSHLNRDSQVPSDFFQSCAINLGPVGRPESKELNADIESYIPFLYAMLDAGKLTGSEFVTVGEGLESIPEAYAYQKSGKGENKKVIVNISDFI